MDGRTDGHLRAALSGPLCRKVHLKTLHTGKCVSTVFVFGHIFLHSFLSVVQHVL